MNRYLLLATVADRIPMAQSLYASIAKYLPTWKIVIVAQEFDLDDVLLTAAATGGHVINLEKRCGPHNAKAVGLDHILKVESDRNFVVCSIDDDMEFLPETNLDPAVSKALATGTGFVSCGWAAHPNKVKAKNVRHEFVRQAIVYTGGGMVFGPAMARLVVALPRLHYFDDNTEWSLAAYVAGYSNFRFRGSMTLHFICSAGGRRAWVALKDRAISDPELIDIKRGKLTDRINNYLVGSSSDLTPKAHALHKANKK